MTEELAGSGLPPIVRDAQRLLLAVEQCVHNFPRYHKHPVGADLRGSRTEISHLCKAMIRR
jgi:hypothetical protein